MSSHVKAYGDLFTNVSTCGPLEEETKEKRNKTHEGGEERSEQERERALRNEEEWGTKRYEDD